MSNSNKIELKKSFFNSSAYLNEKSIEFLSFSSSVNKKIDGIEKSPSISKHLLKLYLSIEQKILKEISNSKHKKILKATQKELLYSNFIKTNADTDTDTDADTELRLKIVKIVNRHFTNFLSSIDLRRDLKEDFHIDVTYSPFDKSELQTKSIRKIVKEMENCLFDEFMLYLMTECVTDYVPLFLINKQLINQKVALICKMQYEIPVHTIKMRSQYGYSYLSQAMVNFSLKNLDLFDLVIFNKNLLGKIFKCFFLSNMDFLLANERNFKRFQRQLLKYLRIMNINQPNEVEIIQNYVKGKYFESKLFGTDNLIFNETKQTFDEFSELLSNDFRLLTTEKKSEKVLFIIFSFSLMLNSLIKLNWEKDQIAFSKELQCSACERQLLFNFLHYIQTFIALSDTNDHEDFLTSALNINHYLECSIFSSIIKAKASELFDVSMRYKYDITYQNMHECIKDVFSHQTIFEQEDINIAFFNEHYKTFHKDLILSSKDYLKYTLVPHDRDNISPHICICIDDYFEQCLVDQLNNMNRSVDYYCYDWHRNSSTSVFKSFFKKIFSNEHEETMTEAMFAGRFLAYVIASRSLFKFQTFSLIGISFGANVIKHCINELKRLSSALEYCNDLINDVMFINGQTDFNLKDLSALNEIITGRIINVYSQQREEVSEMVGSNEVIYNKVENYDITHLKLSKEEFTINLDYLLSQVKLFP